MTTRIPDKIINGINKTRSTSRINERTKEILKERRQATEQPKPIQEMRIIEEPIKLVEPTEPLKVREPEPVELIVVKPEKKPKGRPRKEPKKDTGILTIEDIQQEKLNKASRVVEVQRSLPSESCHAVTRQKARCKNPIYENLLCKLHYGASQNNKQAEAIPLVKNNINNDLKTLILEEVTPLSEPNPPT